jgi:hypothetical protein
MAFSSGIKIEKKPMRYAPAPEIQIHNRRGRRGDRGIAKEVMCRNTIS